MRLTISLTAICAMFLLSGCFRPPDPVPVPQGPLFCEVEEKRMFTQAELDWRAQNAPWNLRRDFKTNKALEIECGGGPSAPV